MEAYSLDLRQRICAACDAQDQTRQETADRVAVSRSFVQKLLRRRRQDGSIAPQPHRGGAAAKLNAQNLKRLGERVERQPDATLSERAGALVQAGGERVSAATICRALKRLGWPRKKSRCTRRSGTRPGFGSGVGNGGDRSSRCRRRSWSSWTRAAPTRR